METDQFQFERECRQHLDRFFAAHTTSIDQTKAYRVLRMLRASEKPLTGKPEGWAAGIIYFVATDGCIPCGVPNVSNADFAAFMGVPMETARRRSGRVRDLVLL